MSCASFSVIHLPMYSPDELLGMSFVCEYNGHDFCAKVICKVLDHDAQDHQPIKLLLTLGDGELEEIISYNELSNLISEQHQSQIDGKDEVLSFNKIWTIKDH